MNVARVIVLLLCLGEAGARRATLMATHALRPSDPPYGPKLYPNDEHLLLHSPKLYPNDDHLL